MEKNILFIVTDDQRYDTFHCLGNEHIITPNFDKLINDGTYFDNAYINGGLCGAVCMPSRAMLLTGKNLFNIEEDGQSIPQEHISMPEVFKQNGYYTFATGKWHNGEESFLRGFNGGESIYFNGMANHWEVPMVDYMLSENDNKVNFVINKYSDKERAMAENYNPTKHSTDRIAGSTIDFLDNYDGEKPFFCYTAFLAPHDPRIMPEEFLRMYDNIDIPVPDNYRSKVDIDFGVLGIRDEKLISYPRTKSDVQKELKDYYAMITHLDSEIGKIIDKLKEKKLYDTTCIVLVGDNGLAIGSHGLMGKQSVFEHSVKVPCFIKTCGAKVGVNNMANIYLYDIYPTLLEIFRIAKPDSIDGMSFREAMTNNTAHREIMYYAYGNVARAVRIGDYKYIKYRNVSFKSALYNIKADPLENVNLVKDSQHKSMAKEMKKKLKQQAKIENETNHWASKTYWFWGK